jgi:hypothetical protein
MSLLYKSEYESEVRNRETAVLCALWQPVPGSVLVF